MRRKSFADMNCSVAKTLDVVGDPWTLLIIRDVLRGHRRFGEMQQRLGIPRNTLTDRLKDLVERGILEREVYQNNPERFEYVLTEKGLALRPVILALMRWGDQWSGVAEPPVTFIDRHSGQPIDPVLIDRNSGSVIDLLTLQAIDNNEV